MNNINKTTVKVSDLYNYLNGMKVTKAKNKRDVLSLYTCPSCMILELSSIKLGGSLACTSQVDLNTRNDEGIFEVKVNFHEFFKIITTINKSEPDAVITLTSDEDTVKINNDFIEYSLDKSVMNPEVITINPEKDEKLGGVELYLSKKDITPFINNLEQAYKFASSGDTQMPIIECIQVTLKDNILTFAAIDGFRLSITDYKLTDENSKQFGDFEVCLNRELAGMLIKYVKQNKRNLKSISIDKYEDKVDVSLDLAGQGLPLGMISIIPQGDFFNWSYIMEENRDFGINIDKKKLDATINSIIDMSNTNQPVTKFTPKKNVLTIEGSNVKAEIEVDEHKAPKDYKIGLNAYFVRDALKNYPHDTVRLELSNKNYNPSYFVSDNENYTNTAVILPIRIS